MTKNQKLIHCSPPVGQEVSCVMHGIDASLIKNNSQIKKIIFNSLKECNFGIRESTFHEFFPQGFTGLILLSESHAAIHTYPEYNSIYFSIYSCRGPKGAEKTFRLLKKNFNSPKLLYLNKKKIPIKNY